LVALDCVSSRLKTWKSARVVFRVARGYEMRRSQGLLGCSVPVLSEGLLYFPLSIPLDALVDAMVFRISGIWLWRQIACILPPYPLKSSGTYRRYPTSSQLRCMAGRLNTGFLNTGFLHPTQAPQLGIVEGLEIERVGQRFG